MNRIFWGESFPLGEVGEQTGMTDSLDTELFVGDVVLEIYKEFKDRPEGYSMGVVAKDEFGYFFITGIKGAERDGRYYVTFPVDLRHYFFVVKIKSYKDVVDGERWNYEREHVERFEWRYEINKNITRQNTDQDG